MARVRVPGIQQYIELEYRVAVLENLLGWVLSNAYLTEPIDEEVLRKIYWDAANDVRSRHPEAEIEYGEFAPHQESLFRK